MRRPLTRVRDNHVLVLLDDQGAPHIEIHPDYHQDTGPVLQFYRCGVSGDPAYLFTLRLPVVNALVRCLPPVISAAKRLQNGDRSPGR